MVSSPVVEQLASQRGRDPALVDELVRKLTGSAVTIRISAADATSRDLASHAVALLARVFPKIDLICDSGWSGGAAALNEFEALAKEINPHVRVTKRSADDFSAPLELAMKGTPTAVRADVHGWLVWVATEGSPSPYAGLERFKNPAAPLFAAALAVGQLVAPILGRSVTPAVHRVSMLDWVPGSTANSRLDELLVFDLTVFGVGSVGSAAVLALLGCVDLEGSITLVDNERLRRRDVARYSLMRDKDAGKEKTAWASARLRERHPRLRVTPMQRDISHAARDLPAGLGIHYAIISPDNLDARREAADTLPLNAVSASIDGTEACVDHAHFARTICAFCPDVTGILQQRTEEVWARQTGIAIQRVMQLAIPDPQGARVRLTEYDVRQTERTLRYATGALDEWRGRLIEDMMEAQRARVYAGEAIQRAGHPPIRIALGFVSAVAGAIAVGELIKEMDSALHAMSAPYTKIRVDPLRGTAGRELRYLELRDSSGRCLCQSHDRHRWYATLWPEEAEALRRWSSALDPSDPREQA